MNAKILAVANQKGGVGKTTTSLNLGGALARQGKKVLLLDLDPHACATLNARIYPEDMGLSLHDIFLAREEDWPVLWPQVTHVDALEGMDVAPGNIRLSELEVDFRERRGKGGVLARSLAEQRRNYDFIVLDCPPHVGILLVNALVAADLLIIPIQTDFSGPARFEAAFSIPCTPCAGPWADPSVTGPCPPCTTSGPRPAPRCWSLCGTKWMERCFPPSSGWTRIFAKASARGCTIYGVDAHSRGARAYESLAEEVLALW